jgi:hypothetical protein
MSTLIDPAKNPIEFDLPAHLDYVEELATPIEFMRYCYACDAQELFRADRVCPGGHIGRCTKCNDLKLIPFTRTTLEVCA